MKNKLSVNVFWFRRDLRLEDNTGLSHALHGNLPVLPLFIFDTNILSDFPNENDPRLTFIQSQLDRIHSQLLERNSGLLIMKGIPSEVFENLNNKYDIQSVYFNNDYEPYARNRDHAISNWAINNKINCLGFKDHVIFEKQEILNLKELPYTVFSAYKKKWLSHFNTDHLKIMETHTLFENFLKIKQHDNSNIQDLGYKTVDTIYPDFTVDQKCLKNYESTRDFPHLESTSRIGIHLRFGTISIRSLILNSIEHSLTFLSQLIWREFYFMILWNFPHVENNSFKPLFDKIEWENHDTLFEAWKNGETGYPLVDAGMRQLKQTGYMHNRVRMITASFLVKDLHIDWRLGEAYFGQLLLDYDLALNNGNWQWAAGCGCDAAPYFRVFNPTTQLKRFDPDLKYIKKWIPEFETTEYPNPIVDHKKRTDMFVKMVKGLR